MKKFEIETDINNSPQDINKNIKSLRNCNWTETKNPTKERDIITGQYVDLGNIKGFISRKDSKYVYIEDSMQQGALVKVEINKFLKNFKKEKTIKKIEDFSIQGPNNTSVASKPKEETSKIIPNLDTKSNFSSDQKISKKINKINKVKSFSDLAKEFDSTIMKTKKNSISTNINKKADKKDDKIYKKTTTEKTLKTFTDLVSNPQQGSILKKKNNSINSTIDGKAEKSSDNKITKKINKVKSFSDLISNVKNGPFKNK